MVQKHDHYILVDGHHRALASKKMGVKQFTGIRPGAAASMSSSGLERSADERGLHTLDDVKIIDGSHHPLIEITTPVS